MNFPATVDEVLKEIAKLKLNFIPNQDVPEIDCIVSMPPQVKSNVYNMSYRALKNTLEYCIDKLAIKYADKYFPKDWSARHRALAMSAEICRDFIKYLKKLT